MTGFIRKLPYITAILAIIVTWLWFSMEEPEHHHDGFNQDRIALTIGQDYPVAIRKDGSTNQDPIIQWPDNLALDAAEQLEQMRDSLLIAVLAQSGGTADDIGGALFDSPLSRAGYIGTTTRAVTGPVRSALIQGGDGAIILLPDTFDPEQRHDAIAREFDRMRAGAGGEAPEWIAVVSYCLDEADADRTTISTAASIKLERYVEASELFSSAFGWVQSYVGDEEELTDFLARTDDLIGFEQEYSGLRLTGRKYKSREYGQITSEHVATLFQAYGNISRAQDRLNSRVEKIANEYAQARTSGVLSAYASQPGISADELRFLNDLIRYNEGDTSALGFADRAAASDILNDIRKDVNEGLEPLIAEFQENARSCEGRLTEFYLNESLESGELSKEELAELRFYKQLTSAFKGQDEAEESLLRGAIGFSLDTGYRSEILQEDFATFMRTDTTNVSQVFLPFENQIVEDLSEGDEKLLLCALQQFEDAGRVDIARDATARLVDRGSYQTARYDGGIQGTEVGQILFYTDLLAKLLDMDFRGTFDEIFVEEKPKDWWPAIYTAAPFQYHKQLEELPGTRIWFDVRVDSVYEVTSGNFGFAPTSARVFALSHGSLDTTNSDERQPGYLSGRFVQWFNDNYEYVSAAETSYDELNQLVKWSFALDSVSGVRPSASFLNEIDVRRDHWFPDWLKNNRPAMAELMEDCFHPRGLHDTLVETLAVFHSDWPDAPSDWCKSEGQFAGRFPIWSLRGGVSLPRSSAIMSSKAGRSSLAELPRPARRGYATRITEEAGTVRFQSVPEYNYSTRIDFSSDLSQNGGRITRSAETAEAVNDTIVYSRGKYTELSASTSETTYRFDPAVGRLEIAEQAAGVPTSRTSIQSSRNAIEVERVSAELETATSVLTDLTRVPRSDWRSSLLQNDNISAVADGPNGGLLVKFKGSSKPNWLEITSEATPQINIQAGETMRFGYPRSVLDLEILDPPAAVLARLRSSDEVAAQLRLERGRELIQVPRDSGDFAIDIRGPPSQPPSPPGGGGRWNDVPPQKRLFAILERDAIDKVVIRSTDGSDLSVSGSRFNDIVDSLNAHGANRLRGAGDEVVPVSTRPNPTEVRRQLLSEIDGLNSKSVSDIDYLYSAKELRTSLLERAQEALDAGNLRQFEDTISLFVERYSMSPAERLTFAKQRLRLQLQPNTQNSARPGNLEEALAAASTPRDAARAIFNEIDAAALNASSAARASAEVQAEASNLVSMLSRAKMKFRADGERVILDAAACRLQRLDTPVDAMKSATGVYTQDVLFASSVTDLVSQNRALSRYAFAPQFPAAKSVVRTTRPDAVEFGANRQFVLTPLETGLGDVRPGVYSREFSEDRLANTLDALMNQQTEFFGDREGGDAKDSEDEFEDLIFIAGEDFGADACFINPYDTDLQDDAAEGDNVSEFETTAIDANEPE